MDWIKIETKWFEMAVRMEGASSWGQIPLRQTADARMTGRNMQQPANDPTPVGNDSGRTAAVQLN